jgi:hypothetical protein
MQSENVTVRPYTALLGDLAEYVAAGAVAMMDPERVSAAVFKSYQDAVDHFYERKKKGDGKKKKGKKGAESGSSEDLKGPAIICTTFFSLLLSVFAFRLRFLRRVLSQKMDEL